MAQDIEILKTRQGTGKDLEWIHHNNYSNLYWLGLYDIKIQKALAYFLKEGKTFYVMILEQMLASFR